MTSPGSQFQVTSVPAGTVSDDGEKKSLPTFTVSGPGAVPPPPLDDPPPPPPGAPGVTPMTPDAGLEEDPAQAAATATAMNAAITVRFRIVSILRCCRMEAISLPPSRSETALGRTHGYPGRKLGE